MPETRMNASASHTSAKAPETHDRFIWIISIVALLSGLIAVVRYGFLYVEDDRWQILMLAILFGLFTAISVAAMVVARVGKQDTAAYVMILNYMLCFLSYNALVISPLLLVLGLGLLTILTIVIVTLRNRLWLGLVFAILFIGLTLISNQVNLIQRYDPVDRQGMGIIMPIITAFLVIAILVQASTHIRLFRVTIFFRLLVAFMTLTLVSIISVTGWSVSIQIENRRLDTFDRLQTVSLSKISQIDSWLDMMTSTLDSVEANGAIYQRMVALLPAGTSTLNKTNPAADKANLVGQLSRYLGTPPPLFEAIYLVDLNGVVAVSTGQAASDQEMITRFWENVKEGANRPFVSPLVLDRSVPSLPSPVVFVALPVAGTDGNRAGILIGRANNYRMLQILNDHTGLGLTGETYMVGSDRTLLTQVHQAGSNGAIGDKLNTANAVAAQTQLTGEASFINYRNLGVLGVFRRVSRLDAALLSEQEQQEALQPVTATIRSSLIVGLMALLVTITITVFMTRSITIPVRNLAKIASQVASGDLSVRAQVRGDDEIAMLSKSFNAMTEDLNTQVQNLEQRVAERTSELRERAVQIQVAGEIARDVAAVSDQDDVMNRAVNLIRERFGYYHAGIFLVDERREFAILRAAAGETGLAMLERGHRLRIGDSSSGQAPTGIVGYVVAKGEPRIALDVGADAVYFKNPLLPRTRSELSMPLKVRGTDTGTTTVIGALDVQSTEPNAFNQDDIQILQTLADQLAVAIQKTNLLQQYQASVSELEATYQQYTGKAWQEYLAQSRQGLGFRYSHYKVEPLTHQTPEALKALEQKKPVITEVRANSGENQDASRDTTSLAVPIKLRGQTLGVLNLKFLTETVSQETVVLIEGLADRLALALENARLIEQVQRQAERERQVGQIAGKVRATTDIDSILRTAVQELGRSLGVSQAVIQLYRDDESKETA